MREVEAYVVEGREKGRKRRRSRRGIKVRWKGEVGGELGSRRRDTSDNSNRGEPEREVEVLQRS